MHKQAILKHQQAAPTKGKGKRKREDALLPRMEENMRRQEKRVEAMKEWMERPLPVVIAGEKVYDCKEESK